MNFLKITHQNNKRRRQGVATMLKLNINITDVAWYAEYFNNTILFK